MSKSSLAGLALFALSIPFSFAASPVVPRPANDLVIHLPSGETTKLANYKGKVLAVDFLLTTCPHCQAASRLMTKIRQDLKPRGFDAIGVALNQGAQNLVADFSKNFQISFPVGWADPYAAYGFLQLTPGKDRVLFPQMVLIDRSGTIRYQSPIQGDEMVVNESDLRQHIEALLGSRRSTRSARGVSAAVHAASHR